MYVITYPPENVDYRLIYDEPLVLGNDKLPTPVTVAVLNNRLGGEGVENVTLTLIYNQDFVDVHGLNGNEILLHDTVTINILDNTSNATSIIVTLENVAVQNLETKSRPTQYKGHCKNVLSSTYYATSAFRACLRRFSAVYMSRTFTFLVMHLTQLSIFTHIGPLFFSVKFPKNTEEIVKCFAPAVTTGFARTEVNITEGTEGEVCLMTHGEPALDTAIGVTLIPGTARANGLKFLYCMFHRQYTHTHTHTHTHLLRKTHLAGFDWVPKRLKLYHFQFGMVPCIYTRKHYYIQVYTLPLLQPMSQIPITAVCVPNLMFCTHTHKYYGNKVTLKSHG